MIVSASGRRADGLARLVDRRARAGSTPPDRARPHATVASATAVAQISTASATWSTTAQGFSRENTFAAPTAICATKKTSPSVASRTSAGERSAIVRARTITQMTSRNAASASTRWRNIGVVTPPERGHQLAVHQRPVLEREAGRGPLRADVGPHEQQGAGDARRPEREPREALGRPRARCRRPPG